MENRYIPEISKCRKLIRGFEVRPFVSYYDYVSSFIFTSQRYKNYDLLQQIWSQHPIII